MQITKFEKTQENLDNIVASGHIVLATARRSDGYTFFVSTHPREKGLRLHAGCHQNWPLGKYKTHTQKLLRATWNKRKSRAKHKETMALIASLEATALAKWSND